MDIASDRVRSTVALGKLVRARRKERGWGLKETGRRAGVKRDFVKQVEARALKTFAAEELTPLLSVLEISEVPEDPAPEEALTLLWRPRGTKWVPVTPQYRDYLRARRLKMKLPQHEVAARIGLYASWLTNLEHNPDTRMVQATDLAKLASVLELKPGMARGKWLFRFLEWVGPIPVVMRKGRQTSVIDWSQIPLGEMSDVELAEKLGISTKTVWIARRKAGIPAWDGPRRNMGLPPFSPTAEDLRREHGEFHRDGFRVDWDRVPLGKATDVAIAEWVGCDQSSVVHARQTRGIGPYVPPGTIRWDKIPLGEVPDTWVAEWLGVSFAAVAYQRRDRGIPPAPQTMHGTRFEWKQRYRIDHWRMPG